MDLPPNRFIQAGPGLPQASVGQAVQDAEAPAKIGEAIQGLGQEGFDIANKVRQASDAGTRVAFMSNAEQQASDFSNSLLSRQDYKQWAPDWQQKVSDLQDQAKQLDISPEGMDQLNNQLQNWTTARSTQFETLAANRTVEESKAQILQGINYAASRGDRAAVQAGMQAAIQSGNWPDSTINQIGQTSASMLTRNELTQQIQSDPLGALNRINDPDFVANTYGMTIPAQTELRKQAMEGVQIARGHAVDDASVAVQNGTLTPEQVNSNPLFSDRDKQAFVIAIDGNKTVTQESNDAAWKVLDSMGNALRDPTIDGPSYRNIYNEGVAEINNYVPPNSITSSRKDINRQLEYFSPARGAMQQKNLPGVTTLQDLEMIAKNAATRARESGKLGNQDDPDQKEQSFVKAQDIYLEAKNYAGSQKVLPTPDEMYEHVSNAISGPSNAQTAKSIGKTVLSQSPDTPAWQFRTNSPASQSTPMVLPPKSGASPDITTPYVDPVQKLNGRLDKTSPLEPVQPTPLQDDIEETPETDADGTSPLPPLQADPGGPNSQAFPHHITNLPSRGKRR